jgi:hypothetical protein
MISEGHEIGNAALRQMSKLPFVTISDKVRVETPVNH